MCRSNPGGGFGVGVAGQDDSGESDEKWFESVF